MFHTDGAGMVPSLSLSRSFCVPSLGTRTGGLLTSFHLLGLFFSRVIPQISNYTELVKITAITVLPSPYKWTFRNQKTFLARSSAPIWGPDGSYDLHA